MKKLSIKKIIIGLLILVIICTSICIGVYFYLISPTSKESEEVSFNVSESEAYSTLGDDLKASGLIRSELAYRIYLKLNHINYHLEYGDYTLNKNSGVEGLIETFKKGSNTLAKTITVKFIEGKNMRSVIKTIQDNFSISDKDVLDKLSDQEYLDSLIEKYWFLTDEIKNKDIYYSLEGYLYPDTYEFFKEASVENIFEKMLDNFDRKVSSYKTDIEKSKYSVHELVTLASIIELEAGGADRKSVSGVFYNRIKAGMSLGSDVTGYYGAKMDDWSKGLGSHVNDCNAYNTRGKCVKALPVGAICNPSIKSIEAAIKPESHKYYYFVADCKGKTYLNTNYSGHLNTIAKLKREGNWCDK